MATNNFQLSEFPQFVGQGDEDPDIHIDRFEVVCVAQGIESVVCKGKIFPATLKDEALNWYFNLNQASHAAYDTLVDAFLTQF